MIHFESDHVVNFCFLIGQKPLNLSLWKRKSEENLRKVLWAVLLIVADLGKILKFYFTYMLERSYRPWAVFHILWQSQKSHLVFWLSHVPLQAMGTEYLVRGHLNEGDNTHFSWTNSRDGLHKKICCFEDDWLDKVKISLVSE